MAIYSDYLNASLASDFRLLTEERKTQLRRISKLRGGRDVLVFAADINSQNPDTPIGQIDHLPISDQLANLHGDALDLVLETHGGSGESAEEIVRIIRDKYEHVAVIVPGWAKSAGTIITMAADEILMGPISALGPIDAQLFWQGKQFSAEALLEGLNKIKADVDKTGVLNKAYIPILQGISPGELQSAQNALDFSKVLVTQWLTRYKFKDWTEHHSTGQPVSSEEREERAKEIAEQLCDHSRWLTHSRSIRIADLRDMRLRVTDYSEDSKLYNAITRYYALLQMSFATNIFKVYETTESQIYKFDVAAVTPAQPMQAQKVELGVQCKKCNTVSRIQANFEPDEKLEKGCLPFPKDNKFHCPKCQTEHDLSDTRRQLEAQAKRAIV